MKEEYLYLVEFLNAEFPQRFINEIDNNKDISYWFKAMPSSVFVKSNYTAELLSAIIERVFGGKVRHIIVRITGPASLNYFGVLPKELWEHFPNNKSL